MRQRDTYALGLNRRIAVGILTRTFASFKKYDDVDMSLVLDDTDIVGNGYNGLISSNEAVLVVGVAGLSTPSTIFGRKNSVDEPLPTDVVPDMSFVKTLVALCHEYGHYLENYGSEYDVHNAISELAIIENPYYYNVMRYQLPHEIDAEHIGVNLAWDVMSKNFPYRADSCMLDYVNGRVKNGVSVIQFVRDMFRSRDEVEQAFAVAKRQSVDGHRKLLASYYTTNDMAARLMIPDRTHPFDKPYYNFYDAFAEPMSGAKKDRMIAALVLHVRPEWKHTRFELEHEDLSIEHEFGESFPETTEESRRRLLIFDDPLTLIHAIEHAKRSRRYMGDVDRALGSIDSTEHDQNDYSL